MNDEPVVLDRSDTSLTRLYREHRLSLVRIGVLLLGEQAAAEDAVQDVFASLHRRRVDVTHAYLRAAVVYRCRSVVRRAVLWRRTRPPAELPEPPPGERLELAEEHRAVIAALARLPHRQREVLVLRYYSGMRVAEVAAALDVTEGTVKSSAARGLDRLRELLGEEA
jgi:RNA polymerase sigma factor (sigma-70 family)